MSGLKQFYTVAQWNDATQRYDDYYGPFGYSFLSTAKECAHRLQKKGIYAIVLPYCPFMLIWNAKPRIQLFLKGEQTKKFLPRL